MTPPLGWDLSEKGSVDGCAGRETHFPQASFYVWGPRGDATTITGGGGAGQVNFSHLNFPINP